MGKFRGIARDKRFYVLNETSPAKRLSRIQRQQATSPEVEEIDLEALEGKVVQVEGEEHGEWILEARVTSAQYFRANVGIVLMNDRGQILALERKDKKSKNPDQGTGDWQMPQGGLDELEDPVEGALRELHEELCLGPEKVELVYESPEWLAYELPEKARAAKHGRGQVQKWFLFRFRGEDTDIKLRCPPHEQEFVRAQWTELTTLAGKTWEVRRPTYRRLAKEFAEYSQAARLADAIGERLRDR